MATPAQMKANQENAQKSCGPTSPQGKAKSSLNAISYGFAGSVRFIDGEDPDEFYGLQIDLVRELQPATHVEQILVEKMTLNQWLSLRAVRLQSDALRFRSDPHTGESPKDLGLLIRYQTASDRAFHKAHAELLKAQKERKNSEIGFVSKNQEEPVPEPIEQPQNIDPPAEPAPETQPVPDYVLTMMREQSEFEAELAEMLGVSVEELTRAA